MIEFEALVIKAETDNIYANFLLKKNIKSDIRVFTYSSTNITQGVEDKNHISWTRIQIYRRQIRLLNRIRNYLQRKKINHRYWEDQEQL